MSCGKHRVSVLDLFAGAGGFSQGFSEADPRFEVVAAVEMDTDAAATFTMNHGDIVFAGSIEDWLDTLPEHDVDVVVGGPPCQGFSMLGKRDQFDERNSLWKKYAEALLITEPAYFVLENVPSFLKSAEYAEFLEMVESGALSDYTLEEMVLNAADFGAAQVRKRAIVIGRRKQKAPVAIDKSGNAHSENKTVREEFSGLTECVTELDLPERSMRFNGAVVRGPFSGREIHLTRRYRQLSLDRFEAIPTGGNRFNLPEALQAPCWRKHRTGSADVMGRLRWDEPSVTIRTEFFKPEKGRYIHPSEDRAITHLEAARLQGFPDSYLWCGSKTSIARQIGNAVPVPLSKFIAEALIKAIDLSSGEKAKDVGSIAKPVLDGTEKVA